MGQTKAEKLLERAVLITDLKNRISGLQERLNVANREFIDIVNQGSEQAAEEPAPAPMIKRTSIFPKSGPQGTLKERVLKLVDGSNGPVTPSNVHAEFKETTYQTVATTLSELVARRKIKRIERGVYAPNGWVKK